MYLAGPMRGVRDYNYPLFNRAAHYIRRKGYAVFNPAEHDEGVHPTSPTPDQMRKVQRKDCIAVCDADAICFLPGWEKSELATVEFTLARNAGLDMFVYSELSGPSLILNNLMRRRPKVTMRKVQEGEELANRMQDLSEWVDESSL